MSHMNFPFFPPAAHPHPDLVSVFIAGVQKGGTSSLAAYFRRHPGLVPASVGKEIHFFDDERADWTVPDYGRLHALFPDRPGLRYDPTPAYFHWPPCMERIHAYNPAARLILLFRDPIERAFSQWGMYSERGVETLPFSKAIRDGRERIRRAPPLSRPRRTFAYVERGFYAAQLRRALAVFPREQMLFLRSADLLDRDQDTLAAIARFLGLSEFPPSAPIRRNVGSVGTSPSRMSEGDIRMLAELYRDDLEEFAAMTDLNIEDWLSVRALQGHIKVG
jgi:hypothetical protein